MPSEGVRSSSRSAYSKRSRSKSRKSRKTSRSNRVYEGNADTQWTVDSDPSESALDSVTSEFSVPPLPRATEERPTAVSDPALEEHYRGVMRKKEAARLVRRDDFILYYRVPSKQTFPVHIQLMLCHRNTLDKIYHFPVVKHTENNNSHWWTVLINNQPTQLFRNLSDLVRCYHLYRYTDARNGRSEVFPLWKGGLIDAHQ
ncbi:unnamed protein product [Caenorhabditis auriculariae]|uniref:Uncharacterized protein n=1 Tax=Caenorhabditis auriculariae TaxID=2777116 RepID=A0A8S1HTZ1_9PELO|nr:unnamed protein product [Caenorhabditis auriculariae]